MLFILFLTLLIISSFLFYRKYKFTFLRKFIIIIFILCVLECLAYSLFIYQVYRGRNLLLIGNQASLDNLYKFRLVYALYYAKNKKNYFWNTSDDLGYTVGKNKEFGLYTTNSNGIRGKKEYPLIPSDNIFRIACFGDSFVFCDDEKDKDPWEYYLENSINNLEVINFGVSGYGVSQSYLRYLKDGLKFYPHIIMLNIWETFGFRDSFDYLGLIKHDIDIRRTEFYRASFRVEGGILKYKVATVFDFFDKKFRDENIYNKLYFYKTNGLLNNRLLPLSNIFLLFKTCYIKYRLSKMPLPQNPELPEANLKILEDFAEHVRRNRGLLVIIDAGYPAAMKPEFMNFFEKNKDCVKIFNIRGSIQAYLAKDGLDEKKILNCTNHYNAVGNKILAKIISDILTNNRWQTGNRQYYYDKTSNAFLSTEVK